MVALLLDIGVIVVGSVIGSILKKNIKKEVLDGVMVAIGAVIIFIGATGISTDTNALALLFAYVIGCFIGYGLDLDGKLNRASEAIESKISGNNKIIGPGISFFIVSCSGAYTINACFFAGMDDYSLLYTKVGLDLVVSLAMSSTLGMGVMFSVLPMTIFQGLLILLSGVLSPIMTTEMINTFATAGSIVAALIGANMIGATKIKIVNFIPAILLAPVAAWIMELLPI